MSKRSGNWYEYAGAVHVHTTESDGTKSLEEVARIGAEAGLDFILFADHMTLANREADREGFYGKLLALVGYEHNDEADKNHLLIFDSPGVYDPALSAAEYVRAAREDDALTIVAHPDEQRDRMLKYPPFQWTDWTVDNVGGIELWNQMSEWMERLTRFNRLAMAFSPRKSMVGPSERTFEWFDRLNADRRCVGVASVDAHEFPVKLGPFTVPIFRYKVHFKSLRTYLLLNEKLSRDVDMARRQIYSALRDCRAYGANIRWGDAAGFSFTAQSSNQIATMGDELHDWEGSALEVKLPERAEIRLICDGRPVINTLSDRLTMAVPGPGLYRVEAWRKSRCWIFSNHIRIALSPE